MTFNKLFNSRDFFDKHRNSIPLWLISLSSLVVIINFLFWLPPIKLNDVAFYADFAMRLLDDRPVFVEGTNLSYRIGVYSPMALIIKYFGVNRYTVNLWCTLAHLMCSWAMWFYLKKLIGRDSFWIIAAYITYPLFLNSSYDIHADVIVSAFGGVAMLALIYGMKNQNVQHSLFGLFVMTLAYLCKSSIMVFALSFFVMALTNWRQLKIRWVVTMLTSASAIWLILYLFSWDPFSRFLDFDNTIPKSQTIHAYSVWWQDISRNSMLWGLIPSFLFLPFVLLGKGLKKNQVQIIWLLVTMLFLSTGRLFFDFMAQMPFKERFWTFSIFPVLWFLHSLDALPKKAQLAVFLTITADMALIGDHFRWKYFVLFSLIAILIWLSKWPKMMLMFITLSLLMNIITLNQRTHTIDELQLIRDLDIDRNDTLYLDRRIYEYRNVVFEDKLPMFHFAELDSFEQNQPPIKYWFNLYRHGALEKYNKLRKIEDFIVLDTIGQFDGENYLLKIQLKKSTTKP